MIDEYITDYGRRLYGLCVTLCGGLFSLTRPLDSGMREVEPLRELRMSWKPMAFCPLPANRNSRIA